MIYDTTRMRNKRKKKARMRQSKRDFIYFIECMCGLHLFDYQKIYLDKICSLNIKKAN